MNIEEKITIDKLYTNQIEDFYNNEYNDINKYENKINFYISKINELNSNYHFDNLNKINEYNTKIKKLKNKINKKKKIINQYLLDNSNDLFNYFKIKQNIDCNNNPKKMIHNFFNKKKK
jgi:hypothetical protein